MPLEKPKIIKPSPALAEVFGESRAFIISPPDQSTDLIVALEKDGHQVNLAPDSFESDGETLQCIILTKGMDCDAIRMCIRKFNSKR